jgi:hypothetical protein
MDHERIDLENILDEAEPLDPTIEAEEKLIHDTYGIEFDENYQIDGGLLEVDEAIKKHQEMPLDKPEPEEWIRDVEPPEVIELPDNSPVIIEEPRGGKCYGRRRY